VEQGLLKSPDISSLSPRSHGWQVDGTPRLFRIYFHRQISETQLREDCYSLLADDTPGVFLRLLSALDAWRTVHRRRSQVDVIPRIF